MDHTVFFKPSGKEQVVFFFRHSSYYNTSVGGLGCCWDFCYAPNMSPVLGVGEEDAAED